MLNPLIKYYEVLKNASIWDLDDTNKVALPATREREKHKNDKVKIKQGKYVKSFGQINRYKTPEGKQELLVLVDGHGMLMTDVKLYKDNVDDCGCDGNPVATPSDLDKLSEKDEPFFDKDAAYVKPKSALDRSAVIGLIVGLLLFAVITWLATKDRKKTIIAAVTGGILGAVLGYFIGKRGEKQVEVLDKPEDVERDTDAEVEEKSEEEAKFKAESQEHLQLGKTYDFSVPVLTYAMMYGDGTFYVARKNGRKQAIKPGARYTGKLVEVEKAQFFIPDPKTKKVVKMRSQKPLPFIDLGNKLYLPLSATDASAVINTEEVMDYLGQLGGGNDLEKEVYVKGRYAGKRLFNLMYFPAHESTIRQMFGKR